MQKRRIVQEEKKKTASDEKTQKQKKTMQEEHHHRVTLTGNISYEPESLLRTRIGTYHAILSDREVRQKSLKALKDYCTNELSMFEVEAIEFCKKNVTHTEYLTYPCPNGHQCPILSLDVCLYFPCVESTCTAERVPPMLCKKDRCLPVHTELLSDLSGMLRNARMVNFADRLDSLASDSQ